jgi:hypothetical protein
MRTSARIVGLGIVVATGVTVWAAQETVADFQGPSPERFLADAKIVARRELGTGITRPIRVTLEANGRTHFAVFKNIDERKFGVTTFPDGTSEVGFQDSWQTEVAAYRVDRIIGLGMVPATVERRLDGAVGSFQWFVESMVTEAERLERKIEPPDIEAWNQQSFKARLFDELICNVDRHLNNLLVTKEFEMRLIDHSRSFRSHQGLMHPERLTRFSRSLLEGLARLDRDDLKRQVGKYLDNAQIDRLLRRRDEIVALAARLVAERGEAAVIYP